MAAPMDGPKPNDIARCLNALALMNMQDIASADIYCKRLQRISGKCTMFQTKQHGVILAVLHITPAYYLFDVHHHVYIVCIKSGTSQCRSQRGARDHAPPGPEQ